jgi:uncharacterized membrane protein
LLEKAASRSPPAARNDAESSGLNSVLERNIEVLVERRRQEEADHTREERIAIVVSSFVGSMAFVYVHLAIVALWVVVNVWGVPGIPRVDPSLEFLAVGASLEAIFLSTFVLINQNRMAAASVKRADLGVQMSLLTEHELTRLIGLVSEIAKELNVKTRIDHELDELKQDVAPEAVLDKLENVHSELAVT